MGKQVKKSKSEIATIDCNLITIETLAGEFGFDTANKINLEPQIETTEAVKLVIKGILRAQKPEQSTITGHKITLTDNVFNGELVKVLQGGEITYDPVDTDLIVKYLPPAAGSSEKGEVFRLNAYTAQYDASGQIVRYEKISYPNCTGVPVAFNSEDGAFRVPEYVINSAPKTGERPYELTYVNELPTLVDSYVLSPLTVTSVAGLTTGKTAISVSPVKEEFANKYFYKTSATAITLPLYGATLAGYTSWDGITEITAATGQNIAIVECDVNDKAISGGAAIVTAKA